MHALVRFADIAAGNTFTTAEIHPAVLEALGCAPECYTLASLRYDLSKLRAKGLVAKLPNSRRYQLLPQGYSICLVFLKLFERVYAPLTAGLLSPVKSDARVQSQRRSQLDRLYHRRSRHARPSRRPKSRVTSRKREQNLRYRHDNGLRFFADCCCEKEAPSGQLEVKTHCIYRPLHGRRAEHSLSGSLERQL
jgi:hypothetical protein